MGAAVHSVNAVGEAKSRFTKAIVILEGDLNHRVVCLTGDIDRYRMTYHPIAIEVADEAGNPPFKVESPFEVFGFVSKGYFHPFVEIGHLPQAFAYRVEIVADVAEYLPICKETGSGAVVIGFANLGYLSLGYPLLVFLMVDFTIAPDINTAPFGEGIDHRGPYAMQSTRYCIGLAAELGTGMQYGHHCFQG